MAYLLSNVSSYLYVPVVREYVHKDIANIVKTSKGIALRPLTCSRSRARMCNGCLLLTVHIQQPTMTVRVVWYMEKVTLT